MFLKIWQVSQEFLSKNVAVLRTCNFIKKDSNAGAFLWILWIIQERVFYKKHLRTAGSKTQVRGFLFNKVASLMNWRPLTVLGRDSSTGIFLQILCSFKESFFLEHLLATFSCMMFLLLLLFLQINDVCSLKSIYLVK